MLLLVCFSLTNYFGRVAYVEIMFTCLDEFCFYPFVWADINARKLVIFSCFGSKYRLDYRIRFFNYSKYFSSFLGRNVKFSFYFSNMKFNP